MVPSLAVTCCFFPAVSQTFPNLSASFLLLHQGERRLTAVVLPRAGDSNPEHMFVATQDRGLRARLMRVPGSAAVFASVNGLHLEAPSEAQKANARAGEAQSMTVAPHELKVCGVAAVAALHGNVIA